MFPLLFCALTIPLTLSSTATSEPTPPPAASVLSSTSAALNEVAQKALPAVVSIASVRRTTLGATLFGLPIGPQGPSSPDPNDDAWDSPPMPKGRTGRALTVGSGFVVDPRGYVLTNFHVVENSERITVSFDDKRKVKAQVVGSDPSTDLAVLKLSPVPSGLTTIPFANSDQVKVGDWAIAIGSPFGLKHSVTVGIVSAKGRGQMGVLDTEDFIQTDAAINPGSSGGPLLNIRGEVIGLNTAIFSQSGGFIGIGFAVPARIAKEVSDELIQHGRVRRSWLGLTAQDLDPELARYFKLPSEDGAIVTRVTQGSPADRALLLPGDVITRFDRQKVESSGQLKSLVAKAQKNTAIEVDTVRDGAKRTRLVQLREQPQAKAQMAGRIPPEPKDDDRDVGLTVRDVAPELARFLKIPRHQGALVVDVRPGSPAFEAGLAPGDVILKANQTEIHGARDLVPMVRQFSAEHPAVLYVQRGSRDEGERIFIPIVPG